MSGDERLWTYKPPVQSRKPRPTEPVWSMRKDNEQIDCAFLGHGEWGWEMQLLRNGEWFYGRRRTLRAEAQAEADDKRDELKRDGWTDVSSG
jgi:hypothetical protein